MPVSVMPELIRALAWMKKAAAKVNERTGDIDSVRRMAIADACDELLDGQHHDEFVVDVFDERAKRFDGVQKLGRTQLQDAVPMTVGQELRAFAISLAGDVARFEEMQPLLLEVNLGGTAIGTAVGVSDHYLEHIVPELARVSGLAATPAGDRIEATWDTGIFVFYGGLLKRLATKLSKIANDLRLLSSGPFGGIGELELPAKQSGSSIMPGKVNPVIPEVVNQTCYRVFGADTTVTFAAESGQLQLNAMQPVILWSIYEATGSLIAAVQRVLPDTANAVPASLASSGP